jgi:hypothetical protein
MKPHRILVLVSALGLAQLALAEEPAPDARALATTEAILSYCAKVDPSGASKYQERVKLVAQGASEKALDEVRKSGEYQQARASMDDFLAKVDEHNAKKVCSEAVAVPK